MKKYIIIMYILSCCLCLQAQTTRFVNVGLSINTSQQNWILNTIYAKPFYTIFTWTVECKDMSSVFLPENIFIEDIDTHVRYGLAKKPAVINPSTFNQAIKYELTFKGIPSSVKNLKLVTPIFTIDNLNLGGRKMGDKKDEMASVIIEDKMENRNEGQISIEDDEPIVSDVDINIPETKANNKQQFAVIIANENYKEVEKVPHALHDGETFKKYCENTLGVPASNIKYVADATYNNIRRQVNWLCQVMDVYQGEANIIFYYAGHGIPNEKDGAAYLLPIDGYGNDVTTGYSLDQLYADLSSKPAKSIMVLLDACFSGTKRDGGMIASARGVAIKSKQNAPKGKMVVLSAAQGDETAYPYKEKGHGIFTYYLLKKLQDTKGDVTFGELVDYVTQEVKKQSVVVNGKMQTPTALPSNNATGWRSWKLR